MRHRSRLGGHPRGGAAAAAAVGLALLLWICAPPLPAAASCCSCRTCPGAAFCIDAVGTLGDCATICTDAGCMNGVYETDDDCAGGCDGFPEAPTLTPSPSPSATPTLTPTATASASPSATAEGSATATGTETETPTVTPSPPPTETPSLTPTATVSGTPTATPTETPSGSPTATPTITPTGTVTGTPTETPALGGAVRYYTGDRPVPGVDVNLIGAPPAATTTDASGHFGFAAVGGGTQTLEPSKQGDVDNGITSLDASHVLQLVAGLRMFNGDQRLACDVTGNGTVSALDATRILQFQADLLQRFEVADLCGSDWVFRPVPAPAANQIVLQPMIGEGVCEPGAITYSPLVPPALGQDFVAILFGDCTGNWNQQ